MNKYSIITAIAITIIVIPFIHSGLSIYGAQQLEYRWHDPVNFSLFAMLNHGEVEFCNPMPFWTSFHKLEMATFYEGNHLGSLVIYPVTVNPFTSTIQNGVFISQELTAAQHVFMTMDFELDGGDIRLDPNQFIVIASAETPILGLIPYSTTTQYDIVDFDDKMKSLDLSCN